MSISFKGQALAHTLPGAFSYDAPKVEEVSIFDRARSVLVSQQATDECDADKMPCECHPCGPQMLRRCLYPSAVRTLGWEVSTYPGTTAGTERHSVRRCRRR